MLSPKLVFLILTAVALSRGNVPSKQA